MPKRSVDKSKKGVFSASVPWRASDGQLRVADIVCAREAYPAGSAERMFHYQWALILIERGGFWIGASPEDGVSASAGDIVLMRPHTMHSWRTDLNRQGVRNGLVASFAIFIPPARLTKLLEYPENHPHYSVLNFDDTRAVRQIRNCFKQMISAFNSRIRYRTDLQFNLLEQILLWIAESQDRSENNLDQRLDAAIQFMAANLHRPISMDELSGKALASRSALTALFQHAVGQSPMQYLQQLRIQRAKQLLATSNQKLDVLAEKLGFCDAKYFSHRFKRLTGMTPGEYRRRNSSGQM